jgi:hypothetical protein
MPKSSDVALERPRDALGHARRRVAEERGHDLTLAPDARVPRVVTRRRDGRVLDRGVVGVALVEPGDALDEGVGERGVRARPRHQVRVAGRRPACDPAAVPVLLDEAVHQLAGHLRREQGVRRPRGPVRVPEAVVDVDLAVDHGRTRLRRAARARLGGGLHGVLPHRAPRRARVLVRRVRIQEQAVEVRVERRALVVAGALDLDGLELAVPAALRATADALDGVAVGELELEVVLGLRGPDQRGRDPHVHRAGVEARVAGRRPVARG